MRSGIVELHNDRGWRLVGSLLLPPGRDVPFVVFVHGLASSEDCPRSVLIATRLLEAGLGSLMLDLSGRGGSEGERRVSLEQFARDIAAAVRYSLSIPQVALDRIALAGSGLGGIAALYAAVALRIDARALVLQAPPEGACERLLPKITTPTLLLADSAHPSLPTLRRLTSELPPDARLEIVASGGHPIEDSLVFVETIATTARWLKLHLRRRQKAQEHRERINVT